MTKVSHNQRNAMKDFDPETYPIILLTPRISGMYVTFIAHDE